MCIKSYMSRTHPQPMPNILLPHNVWLTIYYDISHPLSYILTNSILPNSKNWYRSLGGGTLHITIGPCCTKPPPKVPSECGLQYCTHIQRLYHNVDDIFLLLSPTQPLNNTSTELKYPYLLTPTHYMDLND